MPAIRPEDKWNYCRRNGLGPAYAKYWMVHAKCEVEGCRDPSEAPVLLREDLPLRGEFVVALCVVHKLALETIGPLSFCENHRQFIPKVRRALKLGG